MTKTWIARHSFSTKKLASLFPTAKEIDFEVRCIEAQRSLRGEAGPVDRDYAASVITEARYLGLKMGATNRALNLRWRKIR